MLFGNLIPFLCNGSTSRRTEDRPASPQEVLPGLLHGQGPEFQIVREGRGRRKDSVYPWACRAQSELWVLPLTHHWLTTSFAIWILLGWTECFPLEISLLHVEFAEKGESSVTPTDGPSPCLMVHMPRTDSLVEDDLVPAETPASQASCSHSPTMLLMVKLSMTLGMKTETFPSGFFLPSGNVPECTSSWYCKGSLYLMDQPIWMT